VICCCPCDQFLACLAQSRFSLCGSWFLRLNGFEMLGHVWLLLVVSCRLAPMSLRPHATCPRIPVYVLSTPHQGQHAAQWILVRLRTAQGPLRLPPLLPCIFLVLELDPMSFVRLFAPPLDRGGGGVLLCFHYFLALIRPCDQLTLFPPLIFISRSLAGNRYCQHVEGCCPHRMRGDASHLVVAHL
jgi:hypothetical protein